jgi:uncharacterized protein YgiB involved in biofilm formation
MVNVKSTTNKADAQPPNMANKQICQDVFGNARCFLIAAIDIIIGL